MYKNLEIILVDDGSTDNCPQMCDAWAERDSRIIVMHKENGGVSSARNIGLDYATGQYIGFVDADDYISPEMYSSLQKNIEINKADVSICNFFRVTDIKQLEDDILYTSKIYENENILENYFKDILTNPAVMNKLYTSIVINSKKIRFNDKICIGEDFVFNYLVFKNSHIVSTIKDNLYYYTISRDDSATFSVNENTINRFNNTKNILKDYGKDSKIYYILLKKYASELLCCLRELLRTENKKMINLNYNQICHEIKIYKKEFLKLNITRFNRLSIKIISINSNIFKLFYTIFLKLKHLKSQAVSTKNQKRNFII